MPLKLRLKPGEKLIVNGAVMTAGENGATLVLHNPASLLRGKDVITEEEVTTPARRLYYIVMCMYIERERRVDLMPDFLAYLQKLHDENLQSEFRQSLIYIHNDVSAGEFYRALKTCKAVIALENEIAESFPAETRVKQGSAA